MTPEPFERRPDTLYTPAPDLGGDNEPDTNPTQDNHVPLPEIAPAPLEPLPPTPPANLAPLAPNDHSASPDPEQSPEQSPTIPIAIRRTRREIRPPTEWWKVKHPTPAIQSDSEGSEDEFDGDSAEFAGAAHDLDPKSLKAALRRSDAEKWQEAVEFEFDNHIRNGTWEMLS